jgi:hypothetical protein
MLSSPRRLVTVLASLTLLLTAAPAVTGAVSAQAAIEDYAFYDGQSSCAREALPGTAYLLDHLVRRHPGTRPVSTLRACDPGTISEHQDGRALDWGLDAADPRERKIAAAWLEKVFAADRHGNEHALARRMGIMYVIWDNHIYSAYDGFEKEEYRTCASRPRSCSKTTGHRDHIHISLSRAGAAAQTSFYRRRGVPSVPVLVPGTRRLDPESTAEVTVTVPATGETVRTDFRLTRGVPYRIVADGLVRLGARSRIADAACRWTRRGWAPTEVLLVNGHSPWGECVDGHTYETVFVPSRTTRLRLSIPDDTPGDAAGSLTFSILREDLPARSVATPRPEARHEPRPARRAGAPARRLDREELTVRAAARHGTRTDRALRRRHSYRVVVRGTATSGSTSFDGSCVRYAGRWRPQHTLDLTDPTADHLSLFIQGVRVELRVPGAQRRCAGREHRYVGRFRPVVNGRARVRVWDPYEYADNAGALSVVLRRRG